MNSFRKYFHSFYIQNLWSFTPKCTIGGSSFKNYLTYNKDNRILLVVGTCFLIIQISIFKYFYPNAGFINGDSYQYITSAFYNLRADIYPIGYPKFLRLFSVFSYNDTSLVVFQYFFIEAGLFFVVFSLDYFYKFRSWLKITLIVVSVFNPVFLYLANYVSTDSIFLGLSLIWFGHLIWIVNKPSVAILFSHGLFILLAFTVRYNALFYPLITCLVLFISREKIKLKVIGVLFSLCLVGLFMIFTSNQWFRITGIKQFSPFTGWQMANNAMYAYKFVDSSERKLLPIKFKELDQDVRNFFDSTKDHSKYPAEMLKASTVYMWDSTSPLNRYMRRKFKDEKEKKETVMWGKMGPFYNDYGKALIRTYPATFTEYYLWQNLIKYYAPPVEFLEYYSTNVDSVPPIAKQWFWYSSNKLKFRFKDMKVNILYYYPIIAGISNALFLALSIVSCLLSGIRFRNKFFQFSLLTFLFWIINLVFSVFASPIALRFQLFPFMISLMMDLILIDYILLMGKSSDNEKENSIEAEEVFISEVRITS